MSGLYMGQSAPLGRGRDIEDVKLSNLVAESPLIVLKKAKLGKSANKAEVYRMQKQQKADAKAASKKQQQRTVLLTKETDD